MSELLETKQFIDCAGNPKTVYYYAPPETREWQPDGRLVISRAKTISIQTPKGQEVRYIYRPNSYGSNCDGYWQTRVDNQLYRGPVIVICGPEVETTIYPPPCKPTPIGRANSARDGFPMLYDCRGGH